MNFSCFLVYKTRRNYGHWSRSSESQTADNHRSNSPYHNLSNNWSSLSLNHLPQPFYYQPQSFFINPSSLLVFILLKVIIYFNCQLDSTNLINLLYHFLSSLLLPFSMHCPIRRFISTRHLWALMATLRHALLSILSYFFIHLYFKLLLHLE